MFAISRVSGEEDKTETLCSALIQFCQFLMTITSSPFRNPAKDNCRFLPMPLPLGESKGVQISMEMISVFNWILGLDFGNSPVVLIKSQPHEIPDAKEIIFKEVNREVLLPITMGG